MEVLKVSWCTNLSSCIGIIKARDVVTNEIFIYIGVGQGISEEADIAHILAYGTKYELEVFKSMID